MTEKDTNNLFKATVCFTLAYLIYFGLPVRQETTETKVCCSCGITYVVNHKSYVCRCADKNYHFCNKDCMFRFQDYYKWLQEHQPAKADQLLDNYAKTR